MSREVFDTYYVILQLFFIMAVPKMLQQFQSKKNISIRTDLHPEITFLQTERRIKSTVEQRM